MNDFRLLIKEDSMAEKSSETLRQEVIEHSGGPERNGTGPGAAQGIAGRFDPFHDPYLADPYPFFAQARAATPVNRKTPSERSPKERERP